jgi:hypothetical protein
MRRFRLDVSRKTGMTTLWMSSDKSPCGYLPIIGWEDISGLREFADMLMEMYRHKTSEDEQVNNISYEILEQVFTDSGSGKGENIE